MFFLAMFAFLPRCKVEDLRFYRERHHAFLDFKQMSCAREAFRRLQARPARLSARLFLVF